MLWREWYRVVAMLGKSCSRRRTFSWLVCGLAMMSLPHDGLGVAGLVRAGGLSHRCYRAFLRLFQSTAIDLEALSLLWIAVALRLFCPVRVRGHPLLVVDATKRPKEGRKMPGVKMLHQDSDCNTKRPFMMGHHFQTLGLLVRTATPVVWAVPLVSRLAEGIRLSPSDRRGIVDKIASLILVTVNRIFLGPLIVVADSFYACRNMLLPLKDRGHHVVTRLRSNGAAHWPFQGIEHRRGRKRKWGARIKLKSLFAQENDFREAVIISDSESISVRYLCVDLLWLPVKGLVRFVLVKYPDRPDAILMSSDTSMPPQAVIQCYAYRFRIELTFRAAIHALHGFAYRFWLMAMKPWHFGDGPQYLHRATPSYREAVLKKITAYNLWSQMAAIAQGLLMHLAINMRHLVWARFHHFMRTIRRDLLPSEQVTQAALQASFDEFRTILVCDENHGQFFARLFDIGTKGDIGPPKYRKMR